MISTFIVGISCAYYFSYNNYNNRIFLNKSKNIIAEKYPFYKNIFKYTKRNVIYVKLQLVELPSEDINEKTENKTLELIENLDAIFEFYYDPVNFKILSPIQKQI